MLVGAIDITPGVERHRLRKGDCLAMQLDHATMFHYPTRKLSSKAQGQGVIIPKPLLAEVGLTGEAEMRVENGAIVLRPARRSPREGWAQACAAIAAAGDDRPVWPEFANEGDETLAW